MALFFSFQENILVDSANRAKLIDFGFSVLSTDLQRPALPPNASSSRLSGKTAHRAPELNSTPNASITYQTDVFACGSTFFQLLHNGHKPADNSSKGTNKTLLDTKWDNQAANSDGNFKTIYGMLADLVKQELWNDHPCARVAAVDLSSLLESCFLGTYVGNTRRSPSCTTDTCPYSFGAGVVASASTTSMLSAPRKSGVDMFLQHAQWPRLGV